MLLSRIPDVTTFAQIGQLIGYSDEWVRQRLVQAPERLYKQGKRYTKCPEALRKISCGLFFLDSDCGLARMSITNPLDPGRMLKS